MCLLSTCGSELWKRRLLLGLHLLNDKVSTELPRWLAETSLAILEIIRNCCLGMVLIQIGIAEESEAKGYCGYRNSSFWFRSRNISRQDCRSYIHTFR